MSRHTLWEWVRWPLLAVLVFLAWVGFWDLALGEGARDWIRSHRWVVDWTLVALGVAIVVVAAATKGRRWLARYIAPPHHIDPLTQGEQRIVAELESETGR